MLFDVGFGGYNYSWRVAEAAYAQDFVPDIISSDLQQFNVAGPAYSLANVMTCFMRLGMTLQQVIERVTSALGQGAGDDRYSAGTAQNRRPAR